MLILQPSVIKKFVASTASRIVNYPMLQTLRHNTWVVKVIIGAVAIMMIIFFGSDTIRSGEGGSGLNQHTPAKVNGTNLSGQRVNAIVSQEMESYQQFFKDGVPEQFANGIRQNVINSLINRELLSQESLRMGLSATPNDVANFVREQPQFQENGIFSQELYNDPEGYRVAFQQRNGVPYTTEITNQLTLDKLMDTLVDISKPADEELQWLKIAKNTKFEFSVIKIDKKPKTDTKIDEKQPDKDPKATAELINSLWKQGHSLEVPLKERGLVIKDSGLKTYGALKSVLDGIDDSDKLKVLANLTMAKPFPETYLETPNFYYLVRLKSFKQPDAKDEPQTKDELIAAYKNQATAQVQDALLQDLREQAKIVLY